MKNMKMMSSPFQDFFILLKSISPFTPKHQSTSSPYFSPYIS